MSWIRNVWIRLSRVELSSVGFGGVELGAYLLNLIDLGQVVRS